MAEAAQERFGHRPITQEVRTFEGNNARVRARKTSSPVQCRLNGVADSKDGEDMRNYLGDS